MPWAGPIETKLDRRTHVHPGSVSGTRCFSGSKTTLIRPVGFNSSGVVSTQSWLLSNDDTQISIRSRSRRSLPSERRSNDSDKSSPLLGDFHKSSLLTLLNYEYLNRSTILSCTASSLKPHVKLSNCQSIQ